MASIAEAKKKPYVPRFKSWSASRLDDHDRCPYYAKLKHLDKLCTLCFKGQLRVPDGGTFGVDDPVCTSCGETPSKGEALERGGKIGDRLDRYLQGEERTPGPTILHPKVKEIVKAARDAIKRKEGAIQISIRFTNAWEVIPGDGFDARAWLYTKLDYRRIVAGIAHVTDWKTGGVDKKTGQVKVADKYDDQLLTYQVATLASCPHVSEVTANLVFLDAGAAHDPVLDRDTLHRRDFEKAKAKLARRVLPLLNDTDFAPRSSYACSYCDYAKKKGGPCRFGA